MLWAISSLLCLVPGLTVIYYALQLPYNILYRYHPLFMSISFILLFTSLAHQLRKNVTAKWSVPSNKRQFHSYGMIAASILALSGFFVIYVNKNLKPESATKTFFEVHFTSWHGKFGLLTTLLLLVQFCLGLPTFFKEARLIKSIDYLSYRKYHALCGILFSVASCLVLVTAFQTGWFVKQFHTEENPDKFSLNFVQYGFAGIVILAYGLIVLQVYQRYLQKSAGI